MTETLQGLKNTSFYFAQVQRKQCTEKMNCKLVQVTSMKERNVKISNDTDHDDNYRDNSNSDDDDDDYQW